MLGAKREYFETPFRVGRIAWCLALSDLQGALPRVGRSFRSRWRVSKARLNRLNTSWSPTHHGVRHNSLNSTVDFHIMESGTQVKDVRRVVDFLAVNHGASDDHRLVGWSPLGLRGTAIAVTASPL